jgi:hypothetical protein
LNKIDELELSQWYLQDAQESANVYSNQRFQETSENLEQEQQRTSGKKVPQKVQELEMFQVYEQIRSTQK